MNKDNFQRTLERYLFDAENLQTLEDIIYEAVGDHLFYLMGKGFIPEDQLDEIESILKQEAEDYLKKKMYGYLSVNEFRKSLKKNAH